MPDGGEHPLRAAIAYPYLTPGGGSDPSARVAAGSFCPRYERGPARDIAAAAGRPRGPVTITSTTTE